LVLDASIAPSSVASRWMFGSGLCFLFVVPPCPTHPNNNQAGSRSARVQGDPCVRGWVSRAVRRGRLLCASPLLRISLGRKEVDDVVVRYDVTTLGLFEAWRAWFVGWPGRSVGRMERMVGYGAMMNGGNGIGGDEKYGGTGVEMMLSVGRGYGAVVVE
jgi:hypothetical protein